jgi:hypothetical protein
MRKFRKSHMRPFSWRSSKNASMPKPSMLAVCVCVCECAEAVDARCSMRCQAMHVDVWRRAPSKLVLCRGSGEDSIGHQQC